MVDVIVGVVFLFMLFRPCVRGISPQHSATQGSGLAPRLGSFLGPGRWLSPGN